MHINQCIKQVHDNALDKGFYDKIYEMMECSNDKDYENYRNLFISQQLMLVVSELGEAIEGLRNDDYRNFKEEIADSVIRIFDLSGFLKVNLEFEIERKMAINKNRAKLHNKKF